jgi:hypothetical protein
MMLQISTGKFFKHDAYETLRRALYYTNYRMFREDERIETQAGSLQPVIGVHGLGALTCEIIERIQKQPGGSYPGEVIATGGDTLVNDFAAIVSFALDITCITDLELYADWWQASGPAWARTRCPRNTFPVCLMAP